MLTTQEQELVSDILTWWAEGLDDALDETTTDPTIPDIDTLTTLSSSVQEQKRIIRSVLDKLEANKTNERT